MFRLAVFLLFIVTCSAHAKTLVFAEFDYIQRLGHEESGMMTIIRQAVKEQGYDMEVRFEPGRRAIFDALAGKVDGLLLQGKKLNEEYPTLIRVEQSLGRIPLYFYSARQQQAFDASVCNDMIGIINGFERPLERYSQQLGCSGSLNRVVANYPKQLVNLLQGKRVKWIVGHAFLETRFRQLAIQPLFRNESSALFIDLYMFLNKAHADLANPLAQSLRKSLAENNSMLSPF
jgi:hypothetical protein